MSFTDQQLSAYLDGELAEDEAGAVETALQDDASLRERLARLHNVDAVLSETLGGIAEEDVPDHILAMVEGASAAKVEPAVSGQVVTLSSGRSRLSGWTMPASLAASLLFGLLIGTQVMQLTGSGAPAGLPAGPVEPGSALYAALERTPSGASVGGISPTLSFASDTGVCREVSTQSQRALACRDASAWTVLVVTQDAVSSGGIGYRTASAETSVIFDVLADQLMTSAPMSAEAEAERIGNQWREPAPDREN